MSLLITLIIKIFYIGAKYRTEDNKKAITALLALNVGGIATRIERDWKKRYEEDITEDSVNNLFFTK